MYLPYNTPHDPFQVPDEYFEMYQNLQVQPEMKQLEGFGDLKKAKYVYAMMTNMDDNIKRIIKLLNQLDIADNTVIIFMSDNGPAGYRYTGGLRGHKGEVFEGGVRVPAFINYAGLPKNKEMKHPVAHYDILPTLAELCGITVQDVDGISFLSALNEQSKSLPYRPLIIRETNYMEPYRDIMIRKGDFKLIARGGKENSEFYLFNLKNDPFEQNNIVENQPEKFNELKSELDTWYKETLTTKNLKILPNIIGSPFENPVRLSRHELVRGYASGWFSRHYTGHYLMKVETMGYYNIKLIFRDTITEPGKLEMKFGPVGRQLIIDEFPVTEVVFEDVLLPEGQQVLQTQFQNKNDIISPFYVEIEKI
jgi:arylsulfatase